MEYKSIKDICLFISDGDWIESKDQAANGIRLIQTGNIGKDRYLNKEKKAKYISDETFKRLNCTEVKEGDILISRLPDPIGRGCEVPKLGEKMITAVDCTIIRIDENVINKRYFLNYIKSNKYFNEINKYATGSTRKRISRKWLEKIKIKLYELNKQEIIAKELDNIDYMIKLKKKDIQDIDNLNKSLFIKMFGSPGKNKTKHKVETINDVCSSIVRGPFGSSLKKDFFVPKSNNSIKVYEQKHAIQKNADIGEYYIDKEKYKELKRFECLPGDIIMSCSGTMGELYQLPSDAEKGIINQALCKFSLNNKITSTYFLYYMDFIIDKLESRGSGIKNIAAVSFIKKIEIEVPPIKEQNQFEQIIKENEKLKKKITEDIIDLEKLLMLKMKNYFE